MDFMGLSVFTALKNKMQWHQARQGVLSENIANAATPGYMAMELKPLDKSGLKLASAQSSGGFETFLTHKNHIAGSVAPSRLSSGAIESDSFEITPDGNSVVLEEQMSKIASNQMDYEAVTSLYTSNLGLLKTAMGRGQ